MLFDEKALREKSQTFEKAPPQDVLAWALSEYAPRVAVSTAFGVEGCALIDMAVRINPDVQVFTVDTGYLFNETRDLMKRIQDRYGVEIRRFEAEISRDEQDRLYGIRLYKRDPDTCCGIRKVEPTRRALSELDAWIAGLRRDQGPTRAGIQILERYLHEDGTPLIKVNPLARWTRRDTWRYVMEHGVPYNPLLDQGYKSIGCWPCTRPVGAGEDERAGRWAGTGKSECGIHTAALRRA